MCSTPAPPSGSRFCHFLSKGTNLFEDRIHWNDVLATPITTCTKLSSFIPITDTNLLICTLERHSIPSLCYAIPFALLRHPFRSASKTICHAIPSPVHQKQYVLPSLSSQLPSIRIPLHPPPTQSGSSSTAAPTPSAPQQSKSHSSSSPSPYPDPPSSETKTTDETPQPCAR